MLSPSDLFKRQLSQTTHRIYTLPVVTLALHNRCNCRCLMCDAWQAGRQEVELDAGQLRPHLATFRALGVRQVVLSGGEPLLHSELWDVCALLRAHGVKITLLSNGLLLARHHREVVRWCDEVIVSLDGSRDVHDAIRNAPGAYERLAEGLKLLRAQAPSLPVSARYVVQQKNYADLPPAIEAARDLGLDQISFLSADVTSTAFNRPNGWDEQRTAGVALTLRQARKFERVVEEIIARHASAPDAGFVAESPEKLRRLVQYALALNGEGSFPPVTCNAPWVSAVIEADGAVRPCFFHRPLGNIHGQPLAEILNSETAVSFRRGLDTQRDPTCRRCVCTLHLGLRTDVAKRRRTR